MACQQYEASILLITAIILAVTLHHVVRYAEAARRQAEILADQFDVQYRPHLRPEVFCQTTSHVGIRLINLAGAEAIEPGVYPKWSKCHKQNGQLCLNPYKLPDPPPEEGFATCSVLAVSKAGHWWVDRPLEYERGNVRVEWGSHPWEERNKHIWTLKPNPAKPEELHFEYGPEE